jgi:hypothetical protein
VKHWDDLPGAELTLPGVADLERGLLTTNALLVLVAASRLRAAGLEIPFSPTSPDPEGALYRLLSIEDETTAHPRYLSLLRRLDSFARAAESRVS